MLGVDICVIGIVTKNHPNDCEDACRDMLDCWLKKDRYTGDEDRTWSTILTTLGSASYAELERSLRKEHFKAD